MSQRIPGGLRCMSCGTQWSPPQPPIQYPTRKDYLNGSIGYIQNLMDQRMLLNRWNGRRGFGWR